MSEFKDFIFNVDVHNWRWQIYSEVKPQYAEAREYTIGKIHTERAFRTIVEYLIYAHIQTHSAIVGIGIEREYICDRRKSFQIN